MIGAMATLVGCNDGENRPSQGSDQGNSNHDGGGSQVEFGYKGYPYDTGFGVEPFNNAQDESEFYYSDQRIYFNWHVNIPLDTQYFNSIYLSNDDQVSEDDLFVVSMDCKHTLNQDEVKNYNCYESGSVHCRGEQIEGRPHLNCSSYIAGHQGSFRDLKVDISTYLTELPKHGHVIHETCLVKDPSHCISVSKPLSIY